MNRYIKFGTLIAVLLFMMSTVQSLTSCCEFTWLSLVKALVIAVVGSFVAVLIVLLFKRSKLFKK